MGRTGRYSDEGIALTFVNSPVFPRLAEEEQKIKFEEMVSEAEVVKKTVECFFKNERIAKEDKHRFSVE